MPNLCIQRRGSWNVRLIVALALLSRHCLEAGSDDMCGDVSESEQLAGSNLLQVHTRPDSPRIESSPVTGPAGVRRPEFDERPVHIIMTLPLDAPGGAQEILPPHLLELGRKLLGSDENLDELVAQSRVVNVTCAGVPMTTRIVDGDEARGTKVENEGQYYGLDALREDVPSGMLHVLDLRGNYGVFSIAAFKKHPESVRAVVVEPIPSTYFLLHWNLWLNGVPELDPTNVSSPGIMVINGGVTDSDNNNVSFCYSPPHTRNAFACDCVEDSDSSPVQCKSVPAIRTETLMDFFGLDPIALVMVDCEGCEAHSLPAMIQTMKSTPDRIKSIAGELHVPSSDLEDIACQFNKSARFVKTCLNSVGGYESELLRCGEDRTYCENEMPFVDQLRLLHK